MSMPYREMLCYQELKRRDEKEHLVNNLKSLERNILEKKVLQDSIMCKAAKEKYSQEEAKQLTSLDHEIKELKAELEQVQYRLEKIPVLEME